MFFKSTHEDEINLWSSAIKTRDLVELYKLLLKYVEGCCDSRKTRTQLKLIIQVIFIFTLFIIIYMLHILLFLLSILLVIFASVIYCFIVNDMFSLKTFYLFELIWFYLVFLMLITKKNRFCNFQKAGISYLEFI